MFSIEEREREERRMENRENRRELKCGRKVKKKKKKNRDQTTKYYRRKKCKGRRCARVKSRCKKLPLSFDVAKSSDWSFHNIFDFTIVRDGSAYIRYIRKLSELLYLNYIYIYIKNEVFLFQVTIPCEQDRVRVAWHRYRLNRETWRMKTGGREGLRKKKEGGEV